MRSDANWAMLLLRDCAWQTTLILGLGGLLSLCWDRQPARAHRLLLMAMIAAGFTPLLSFGVRGFGWGLLPAQAQIVLQRDRIASASADPVAQSPAEPIALIHSVTGGEMAASGPVNPVPKHNANSPAHRATAARSSSVNWPLCGWLVLSVVATAHLLICVMRGRRLLARARRVDDSSLQAAARVAADKLNLAELPAVLESADVRCPVIWCWRKPPALLLPTKRTAGAAPFDWVGILCHELAHWKRRDHWAQFVAEALACAVPWQPLVWWTRRRLATLSERACDDWALAAGRCAANYAESLLGLVPQRHSSLALAALSRPSALARRIRHVLRRQPVDPRPGRRWSVIAALSAACLAMTVALGQARTRAAALREPRVSGDARPSSPAESSTEARRSALIAQIAQLELYVTQLHRLCEAYAAPDGPGLSEEDQQLIEDSPDVRRLADAELQLSLTLTGLLTRVSEDDAQVKETRAQLSAVQDKLASERQRRLQETKTWKRQQTERQYAEYQEALVRARDRLALIDGGAPDMVRKIAELNEGDWRRAFAIGRDLAAMPPDQGFALLKENWGGITSVDARQQLLKAWYFTMPYPLHVRMHPHILDVLHLGATDPSPQVQGWALDYLRSIAFEDFAENYPAYLAWYARQAGRPLYDVLKEGCREYVERLRSAAAAERPALLRLLGNVAALLRDDEAVRQVALDAGALDVFSEYLSDGAATPQQLSAVGSAILALHPPESYLRNLTLPRTGRGTPMNVRLEAIRLLGTPQNKWAVDHLEQLLVQCLADPDELKRMTFSIAQALAAIDDPRVIPTMIGVIAADNTYDTVYGVGYFGLGKLTGVDYDEKHDAAWWRNWWEINKTRFPREAQERSIPVLGTTREPGGG